MDGKNNTLILPWPPSVNHYWLARGKMRFLSAAAKKFRYDVAQLSHMFGLVNHTNYPLLGRLNVQINVFPPDKRVRDIDNLLKSTLDSLTHAGVYLDDSQIDKITIIRKEIDRPAGRVEIIITEIVEE